MPVVTHITGGLAAELDSLSDADPASLADGETLVALHRQMARLQAVTTRAVAAFGATRSWEADGARSAAAWGSHALPAAFCRGPPGGPHGPRPPTHARGRGGVAGRGHQRIHVSVLAGARHHNPVCFAGDEAMLVREAKRVRYAAFVKALAYWVQLADPDGAEEKAQAVHAARRFHFSQSFEGSWFADGLFDPIGGAIVDKVLHDIYEEMFRADWAEAKARVGEGVTAADLWRTPAQRRNDAVVEMARRARAMPADARLPEPLFSVLIDFQSFTRVCELWNGTVVTPGSLVPWLDAAWVERIVFDGPSRVIDAGARRRLFTGATRRAIEVRDRECANEFCTLPAEDCDIDHVQPYAEGGLTTTANGKPLCSYHNRWKQRRGSPAA